MTTRTAPKGFAPSPRPGDGWPVSRRNGASEVQIQEPFEPVGGGLVIVQASLRREDGARVNVAVYCYDDTPPAVVDWLPPIPEERGDDRFADGETFR